MPSKAGCVLGIPGWACRVEGAVEAVAGCTVVAACAGSAGVMPRPGMTGRDGGRRGRVGSGPDGFRAGVDGPAGPLDGSRGRGRPGLTAGVPGWAGPAG